MSKKMIQVLVKLKAFVRRGVGFFYSPVVIELRKQSNEMSRLKVGVVQFHTDLKRKLEQLELQYQSLQRNIDDSRVPHEVVSSVTPYFPKHQWVWDYDTIAGVQPKRGKREISAVGFCLIGYQLIIHYRNIWAKLKPEEFYIILACQSLEENHRIQDYAKRHGYQTVFIGDLFHSSIAFDTVVSHHFAAGGVYIDGENYLLKFIGNRHIKMSYGLGKDSWHFSEWNRYYDLILCFGPYQQNKFKETSASPVLAIGCPRFDHLFHAESTFEEERKFHSVDPRKKTILWLPTWGKGSSVSLFAESMAKMKSKYNVIVRVHHGNSKENIDLLSRLGMNPNSDDSVDNSVLIQMADFVFCDYGGSLFSSLYLDRNIVLLDVEGITSEETVGLDSIDVKMRSELPHFRVEDFSSVDDLLTNDAYWLEQAVLRKKLFGQFFKPYQGKSAKIAALAIQNFHSNGKQVDLLMAEIESTTRL